MKFLYKNYVLNTLKDNNNKIILKSDMADLWILIIHDFTYINLLLLRNAAIGSLKYITKIFHEVKAVNFVNKCIRKLSLKVLVLNIRKEASRVNSNGIKCQNKTRVHIVLIHLLSSCVIYMPVTNQTHFQYLAIMLISFDHSQFTSV